MTDCKIAGVIVAGDSVRFISSSGAPTMVRNGKFGPIIWFEFGKPTTVHVVELPHAMTRVEALRYLVQHDDRKDRWQP